jgi:putative DNA primase/helicase
MTGEAFEEAKGSGWKIEAVPKGATPPPRGPTPAPTANRVPGAPDKYAAVPEAMKQVRRWVCWKYQIRDGKRTKVPHTPGEGEAKSTDPTTWRTFEEVLQAEQFYDGIGFVLGDSWLGIDWDDVRDLDTGEWKPGILEEIKSVGSYAEVSPSGTGAHVIARGEKPGPRCRAKGEVHEIYDSGRYFTVTGDHIRGAPDEVHEPAPGSLEAIYAKIGTSKTPGEKQETTPKVQVHRPTTSVDLPDEEVIGLAERARNGPKFSALWRGDISGYPSHSEADMALCSILAFYTQDPSQIERLVRSSGLYREKWDRADYAGATIATALQGVGETYSPRSDKTPARGKAKDADEEEPPTPPDEATISEARRVLEEEDPIEYLLEVFHTDHAGDDVVALCCYVAAASSVVANSKGLHVLTIGPSGKGKSASYETAGRQLPNGIVIGGGMSDKALLYHEYDEGSIIVVDDRAMSGPLQELFRNATSDIRLKSAWRTVGQNREAITLSIPPRCVWWMASAEDRTDDQFHNRCLQPWVDDSVEADQKFADHFLAQVASGEDGDLDPRFDVCKVMWSFILDEPKPVWVWFAEAIEFQDVSNRRNVRIFIDLIMSFARIRYRQRQVDDRGRIIATLEDFESAVDLYSALVTDKGSQALQLTSEMNDLLLAIRDRGLDQFTINDLVHRTRAPYQTIRRILKGRPERNQPGLLDKCPVIRTKVITASVETNEGIRRGYREEEFMVDLAGLEAWMGGRLITIDEGKLEEVISRISRSFPSLFPHLGKDITSKDLRLNPDLTDNNNIINNNYNVYSQKEESQSVRERSSPSPVCSTLRFENGKRHETALSELGGYPPTGETERESGPVKSFPKLGKVGNRGKTQHPPGERQGDNGDLASWLEKIRLPRNFTVAKHRHNPDRPPGLCSVGLCNRQPTWEDEHGGWPICDRHYQLIKQREQAAKEVSP